MREHFIYLNPRKWWFEDFIDTLVLSEKGVGSHWTIKIGQSRLDRWINVFILKKIKKTTTKKQYFNTRKDTKGVIRSRKSKDQTIQWPKDNGRKDKYNPQNITPCVQAYSQ